MTTADIVFAAFTFCNSVRVVAYVPQIAKAATDQGGAQAISFTTWTLFLLSNATAVAYALVNKADWVMATIFLANAFGCTAIILVAVWQRSRHRNRQQVVGVAQPIAGFADDGWRWHG
jgi:Flp pilus assembly protein TadB